MKDCWPFGAALRGEASNHHMLRWLKTVVVSVVGKGAARSRQVGSGKMSDGRDPSANAQGQHRSHRFLGANTVVPLITGDIEQLQMTKEFWIWHIRTLEGLGQQH